MLIRIMMAAARNPTENILVRRHQVRHHKSIRRPHTTTPTNSLKRQVPSNTDIKVNHITQSLSKVSLNAKSSPGIRVQYQRSAAFINSRRRYHTGRHGLKSIDDVAAYISDGCAMNIVICAGAGISTASGIPDFRTPGTGLYDNLQQYNIPYPEAVFDIDYFETNPRPFFALAKELYPSGRYRPTYAHYFAKLLQDEGRLLRMYTQNIDGLERVAGIPAKKLVEAHGTFATATCMDCETSSVGIDIKDDIFRNKLPRCKEKNCKGIIKPDIVFFGEDLPNKFYSYPRDMIQADLVIVMGTSLEVQPFAGIIDLVRYNVPRVLFNRDLVGPFLKPRSRDFSSLGDLDYNLKDFVTKIGWSDKMNTLITKNEPSTQNVKHNETTRTATLLDTTNEEGDNIATPLINNSTNGDSSLCNKDAHTGENTRNKLDTPITATPTNKTTPTLVMPNPEDSPSLVKLSKRHIHNGRTLPNKQDSPTSVTLNNKTTPTPFITTAATPFIQKQSKRHTHNGRSTYNKHKMRSPVRFSNKTTPTQDTPSSEATPTPEATPTIKTQFKRHIHTVKSSVLPYKNFDMNVFKPSYFVLNRTSRSTNVFHRLFNHTFKLRRNMYHNVEHTSKRENPNVCKKLNVCESPDCNKIYQLVGKENKNINSLVDENSKHKLKINS